MRAVAVFQPQISPAGGAGAAERRRGDPIRGKRKAKGTFRVKGGNADSVGAGAADLGPHAAEEVLQGQDLRLSGSAADHRLSPGGAGRHEDILRGADAGKGQADLRTVKAGGPAPDFAALLLNICSQGTQGRQMQVNGPLAQLAAAGQTQPRFPAAGDQRPHEDYRGAHLHHQFMGNLAAGKLCGVYVNLAAPLLGPTAQMAQNPQRRVHIPKLGHVHQLAAQRAEQRSGKNGKGRVFGALHKAGALQPVSAPNVPYIHKNTPVHCVRTILCLGGRFGAESAVRP